MLEPSSFNAMLSALNSAHSIELGAYTLGKGATEQALLAAAERGAHVEVRLAGQLYGTQRTGLGLHNASEAAFLDGHGIDAAVISDHPTHLKAVIVDGRAFFDDRNWCGPDDLIMSTSNAVDVAATRAALHCLPLPAEGTLALDKGCSLKEEAAVCRSARVAIDMQTETLGSTELTRLLDAAADRIPVRVLYKGDPRRSGTRTQRALERLKAGGVQLRSTSDNHKFCIADDRAWIGSANASGGDLSMSDWGAPVDDPQCVDNLRRRFAQSWNRAKPYADS